MKTYPKEVLEAENKMIMQGHEKAINETVGPLSCLILASITITVIFVIVLIKNAIFA